MKLRLLAFAAALALLTAPAFAFHCPSDMAKIDAVLAENPELSPDEWAKVARWRREGEELHNTGNHEAAVEVLGKALAILRLLS